MTTDQKGAIAEACIVASALKLGVEVYRPLAEGGRYDMIFDWRSRLWRVQCKWACRYDDVIVIRCYSNRRAREGPASASIHSRRDRCVRGVLP
jgi:PD-(D/E)XK endonuclease